MEQGFEHIEELISRYLAGETGADENAKLDAWRRQTPGNEALFEESRKLFEAMNQAGHQLEVDVDSAWRKLNARIEGAETKIVPLHRRFTLTRIAAALLLIVCLGIVARWLLASGGPEPTVIMAGNTTIEQKLPDGSKVFINKNTELSYVVTKSQRQVKLKGEAFFEVVHNSEQPFTVEVNGVMIKDVGTAFNVKALPGNNQIEVLVESGEVQFYTSEDKGLTLVKGEKAYFDLANRTFAKETVKASDNTISYKSKVFHFNDAAIKDVITQINEVYGCEIRLAGEYLANCHLSVEFNNESVDDIVAIIAETLDLETEHKGGAIVLKGNGCPE